MVPRVFVFNHSKRYDISGAAEHGTLTYLCGEQQFNVFDTDGVVSAVRDGLAHHHFDPTQDFICMTGNMLHVSVMLATITQQHPNVKLLMFDACTTGYRSRPLLLGPMA